MERVMLASRRNYQKNKPVFITNCMGCKKEKLYLSLEEEKTKGMLIFCGDCFCEFYEVTPKESLAVIMIRHSEFEETNKKNLAYG